MATISKQPIPSDRAELKAIVKALEKASGYGRYEIGQVFSDWLVVTESALRMLPVHAASIAAYGTLANDSPEDAKIFAQLRQKYGDSFIGLQEAFSALLEAANPSLDIVGKPLNQEAKSMVSIRDYLGPLFESLGKANAGLGQFFTPEPVCIVLSKFGMEDIEEKVYQAMEQALTKHPLSGIFFPTTEGWITNEIAEALAYQFLPQVLSHYTSPTVCDPCVGSGGILLAAAQQLPRWMVHLGLVQFWGNDVSYDCVMMSRINIMLFGLNGWGARYDAAMNVLRKWQKLQSKQATQEEEQDREEQDREEQNQEEGMNSVEEASDQEPISNSEKQEDEIELQNREDGNNAQYVEEQLNGEEQVIAWLNEHPFATYNPVPTIHLGNSLSGFSARATWNTSIEELQNHREQREVEIDEKTKQQMESVTIESIAQNEEIRSDNINFSNEAITIETNSENRIPEDSIPEHTIPEVGVGEQGRLF